MPEPVLSIVLPARNEARVIGRCLAALSRQLHPGVEVILADDGSTDGTPDLVAQRFPAVRVLRLPPRGSAAARRAAIEAARAPLLACLDADCIPCDGWIGAILARADAGPVMGRVLAEPFFPARLCALLEFGEFLDERPRTLRNFAFLNVAGPAAVFRRFPLPDTPLGCDRLLSWRMAGAGIPIRFEPAQALVHAPALDPRSLLRRHLSYARRFVALRRVDPSLPGGRLLRLGPLGAPVVAAGRLARDLVRLLGARRSLGIGPAAVPAYAFALMAARLLDAFVMAAETLRSGPEEEAPITPGLRRDTLSLALAGASSQVLQAARSFLGAHALGPALFGVWQGVRVALQAAGMSDLGAYEGLTRELPLARGRGLEERAALLRGSALLAGGVGAALSAAAILGAAVAGRADLAPVLVAAAVAALLQQLSYFGEPLLRAEARMGRSSLAELVRALVAAALAWPLARAFGVEGFVGAAAAGSAAGAAVALTTRPAFRLGAATGVVLELVRAGWPIKLARTIPELMRSLDKLVVLGIAGTAAAGLYGLADAVARLLGVLPAAAATAVAPPALERFAREGDRRVLVAALAEPLDTLSRGLPIFAGLAAVLSEPATAWLLPRFRGAETATQILCVAAGAASVEALSRNTLVALGRQRTAALLALLSGGLVVPLDVAVLAAGFGIAGVATVSLAVSTALALALLACACRALDLELGQAGRAVGPALLRLVYGGGALLVVQLLRDTIPGGAPGRVMALLLLTAPLAVPRRSGGAEAAGHL